MLPKLTIKINEYMKKYMANKVFLIFYLYFQIFIFLKFIIIMILYFFFSQFHFFNQNMDHLDTTKLLKRIYPCDQVFDSSCLQIFLSSRFIILKKSQRRKGQDKTNKHKYIIFTLTYFIIQSYLIIYIGILYYIVLPNKIYLYLKL